MTGWKNKSLCKIITPMLSEETKNINLKTNFVGKNCFKFLKWFEKKNSSENEQHKKYQVQINDNKTSFPHFLVPLSLGPRLIEFP